MQERDYLKRVDLLKEKSVVLYLSDKDCEKLASKSYNALESSLEAFYGKGAYKKTTIKQVSKNRKFSVLSSMVNDGNKKLLIGDIIEGLSGDDKGLNKATKVFKNNGEIISFKKGHFTAIDSIVKESKTHL
jgi:hypothetical protein